LIGDAAAFIDPLFSSGVMMAMSWLAGKSISFPARAPVPRRRITVFVNRCYGQEGSQRTRRWREMDSNHRSLAKPWVPS
jgi:hypothetical protein